MNLESNLIEALICIVQLQGKNMYVMSRKEAKTQQVYKIKKIFTKYNNLKILDTEKSLKSRVL